MLCFYFIKSCPNDFVKGYPRDRNCPDFRPGVLPGGLSGVSAQSMWMKMEGYAMLIKIDFSSDEAIYQQLCNQIILGIATADLEEGQALPSVRQMADDIGINMHTVNKAYSILRQEGYAPTGRVKDDCEGFIEYAENCGEAAKRLKAILDKLIELL